MKWQQNFWAYESSLMYGAKKRTEFLKGRVVQKNRFPILKQPDGITCGPTCLHSVYNYFGDQLPLSQVIAEVDMLQSGGTLAALLGIHALQRGYKAVIYTFNLKVFDPTWFVIPELQLIEKLEQQLQVKKGKKIQADSEAFIKYLQSGGQIKFQDLTRDLITGYLQQGIPLLTGLSATYLYKSARETGKYPVVDDIRGTPQGHFVVLTSYNSSENAVTIADPWHPESMNFGKTYSMNIEHLICAILLGVVTYDGNFLILVKDHQLK